MVPVSEGFLDAPWRRCAALNRFIMDIAHSNLCFGFELARAKTLPDVLTLQAEYRRKAFNAFYRGAFGDQPVGAGEPTATINQDEHATSETRPPQKERRTADRPAAGTALQKPEQISERGPKRGAASPASSTKRINQDEHATSGARPPEENRRTAADLLAAGTALQKPQQISQRGPKRGAASPASATKRKAERIRSEPKEHPSPDRKADTGAPKRPARQGPQGRRIEIRFGRLDDCAVRFSNREAWRLQNGRWRRISVDKALSDAVVVSEARFEKLFPRAPQLPASAFLPDRE